MAEHEHQFKAIEAQKTFAVREMMPKETTREFLTGGTKAAREQARKGPNGLGVWHRGKGADEWTSGRRDDGGKRGGNKGPKGPNSSKPDLR